VARARIVINILPVHMDHCEVRTRSFHFAQGPAMVACIINETLCHAVGVVEILRPISHSDQAVVALTCDRSVSDTSMLMFILSLLSLLCFAC